MVLHAVVSRHLLALSTEVLLEGRVNNDFLACRVASKVPSKLVPTPLLVDVIARNIDDFIVALFKLAVVFRDCVRTRMRIPILLEGGAELTRTSVRRTCYTGLSVTMQIAQRREDHALLLAISTLASGCAPGTMIRAYGLDCAYWYTVSRIGKLTAAAE